MGTAQPEVSVVIPAYGRADVLARVLRGLRYQRYPAERFEVVVVDDCSPVPLERELDACEKPVRTVWRRNPRNLGDRRSRDAGVAAATSEFIVLLDSDMIPQPEWLRAHVDAHEGSERRAVTGHYGHDPALGRWHPNAWVVAGREAKMRSIFPAAAIRGSATTANMSIKRAVYEAARDRAEARLKEHAEFDPTMNVYGWKDIEFISALVMTGIDLRYSWGAAAWHWDDTSMDGYLLKTLKSGIGTCRYCVLFPEFVEDVLTDTERSVLRSRGPAISRESLRTAWTHVRCCRLLLKAGWSSSAYRHLAEARGVCRLLGLEVARRHGVERLIRIDALDLECLQALVQFVEAAAPACRWGAASVVIPRIPNERSTIGQGENLEQ